MKSCLTISCFLLCINVATIAHAASTNNLTTTTSLLTISNYLSSFNEQDPLSTIQAQSQLTVTPTNNLTVNNIRLTVFNSTDGSCTDAVGNTLVGTINDAAVTLTAGRPYVTTDASNNAKRLADAGTNDWSPATDTRYQLRNGTALVGSSNCIQGGGTCTDATNCGWPSARSWAP